MDDTLINIRIRHWHFKIYKPFKPSIEYNSYWAFYYRSKEGKPKVPYFEVYKFFT